MNYLPYLVHLPFDLGFRPLQARLAQVDRVSEHRATRLDARGITTFGQLDSFALQEFGEIVVQFIFVNRFHNFLCFSAPPLSQT
jgi:hypothetical protein